LYQVAVKTLGDDESEHSSARWMWMRHADVSEGESVSVSASMMDAVDLLKELGTRWLEPIGYLGHLGLCNMSKIGNPDGGSGDFGLGCGEHCVCGSGLGDGFGLSFGDGQKIADAPDDDDAHDDDGGGGDVGGGMKNDCCTSVLEKCRYDEYLLAMTER
jgi:hypothetical protein